MAPMKVLPLLLVLAATNVMGQRNIGIDFRVMELGQNPELLALAAMTGESVIVVIDGPSILAVVQEEVNTNMWCLPWLQRFPGGTIRWRRLPFNTADGSPIPGQIVEDLPPGDPRLMVGGDFNEWLNITRTFLVSEAEDPDTAVYFCEVCIARGTAFEECHTANVTLQVIGAPPLIVKSEDDDGPLSVPGDEIVYNVGADFCIPRIADRSYSIRCNLVAASANQSRAFPNPDRAWSFNGDLLYRLPLGTTPNLQVDSAEFFMDPPLRMLLNLYSPFVLNTLADQGGLRLDFTLNNLTVPEDMLPPPLTTEAQARSAVFDVVVGDWTCEANNTFGNDTATTTIRICGPPPSIPGCPGGADDTLFGQDGAVLAAGCNVCIPEGDTVILDCTGQSQTDISYVWTNDDGDVVSTSPMLAVTVPGNYTCTATNADNPTEIVVSALFYSDEVNFMGQTIERFFSEPRADNGCGRLSNQSGVTADLCIFVGETLNLTCVTADALMTPLEITNLDMTTTTGVLMISDVTAAQDGTYQCRLSNTEGPCGDARTDFVVQVFEPARIDRISNLDPQCTLGAGRPTDAVVVAAGNSVTLCCPVGGIEDPTTGWYRVEVDELGCANEVLVDGRRNTTGTHIISVPVTMDVTYVCRTSNRAGADADVVSIRTDEEMAVWITGPFSACSLRCRDGVRTRDVSCRSNINNMILPSTACNSTARPARTSSCADRYPDLCLLDPVWIAGEWSQCSPDCGGKRTRDVICQVPMTGRIMPDNYCNLQPRPDKFDITGCQECCKEDVYPIFCRAAGTGYCGIGSFNAFCCWTCGIKTIS